jgi:hypothetical protein
MSQPAPILDYASPRASHPLRLPTSSSLRFNATDTGAIVSEFLAARGGAVAGIIMACGVLLLYLWIIVDLIQAAFIRHDIWRIPLIPILFWVGYAGLTLYVINDTWARMLLEVTPQRVELRFLSPLRRRTYGWGADQIAEIFVRQVSLFQIPTTGADAAGELVIIIRNGQPVMLLRGHRLSEIQFICAQLQAILYPGGSAAPGGIHQHEH